MRRSWTCPKCSSQRIGYFEAVSDMGEYRQEVRQRNLAEVDVGGRWQELYLGAYVEAFVCTECGFFEEYVKDPGTTPWNKLPRFRWCRPEHGHGTT